MKIIRNITNTKEINRPIAIALGNFDGVHRGHQQLISQCVEESKERGWGSCVLTFEPHPTMVLAKNKNFKLLNTYEQKYTLLEKEGVEYLYLLSFDEALASVPPYEFVQRFLVDTFHVQKVYVGFNFTFGEKGRGTSATLAEMGSQNGFAVSVLEPVVIEKEVVSSSLIREKYKTGGIKEAARLLGYWPMLEGKVVSGEQRGRTIGFPTANLKVPEYVLLPSYGVYAAYAEVKGQMLSAIVNVGVKPTFGSEEPTVEVHVLDYKANLYDDYVRLHLVRKIRPERKFTGLEELKEQITIDVGEARFILNEEKDAFTNKNFPGK